MVINGAIVSDLDMMFIESVLQEELTLCMMLRSSRPGASSPAAVSISFASSQWRMHGASVHLGRDDGYLANQHGI